MNSFMELKNNHTAAAAAARADEYVAQIRETCVKLRNGRLGESFKEIEKIYARSAGLPGPVSTTQSVSVTWDLQAFAQDICTIRFWEEHRTVYNMDPDLWEELGYVADDDVLPAWLFNYLPHPNPYFSFPAIVLPISVERMDVQSITGAFVTGYRKQGEGRFLCSTHDPESDGLMLLFVGETFNFVAAGEGVLAAERHINDDGSPDYLFTRTSVVLQEGVTFAEIVEDCMSRFRQGAGTSQQASDMVVMLSRIMAALMYVCAKNADLFPLAAPPARNKKAKGAKPKKQTKVVQIGHRVGAGIRAYARSQKQGEGAGTGAKKRPHVRKAHFHTYKVGPGRQQEEVKFLLPIPVNFDGDADVSTVHKID